MNFPAELHYSAGTTLAFHSGNYSDAVSTAVYNSTTSDKQMIKVTFFFFLLNGVGNFTFKW